ncbi:hypothetical protein ID144_08720 [Pseudomonas sp. JM0905a]|uniref:hypothetical protein n=1 Tax=Pseudomonas sp. JM0905a TaxID=2772484 RepID=UPI00168669B6|nr:hypothetical protein [Pseudomonas sp. JM0905a]MBD2837117.1 hypothetical protein [Pseudomonas sp. JM0905a]
MDHTVPLVNVVFRKLNEDVLTDEFVTRRIALSRLCFYQPGYILVNNLVAAKVAAETHWFDVNFRITGTHWSFQTAEQLNLGSPNSPHFLPPHCAKDWSIAFSQGKGLLLLNCMEFLVRGYSRRSEIPRILTTYHWGEAELRLLAKPTPSEEKIVKKKQPAGGEKWIVYPHKDMVTEDDVFLAHIANDDTYAATAARSLFAQVNGDDFKSGTPKTLQVRPWFNSETKLKCRGFWFDDNKSFFCTELVGLQEPSGCLVEARREKAVKKEDATEDRLISDAERLLRENPETLVLTDLNQPRSAYPREEIEDGTFDLIRTRTVRRIKIAKPTDRQKVLKKDELPVEKLSTGDPCGQRDKNTGKAVLATREIGVNSDGVLQEMWKSFLRLKDAGEIEQLWWFVPPSQRHKIGPPQCVAFTEDPTNIERTKWLTLKDGRTRGLLFLLIWAESQFFLVVEIERELKKKQGKLEEEPFRGFICPVADAVEATRIIGFLDAELPKCKGVFKNIEDDLPDGHDLFDHQPTQNAKAWFDATAVQALQKMKLNVKRPALTEELEESRELRDETIRRPVPDAVVTA